MTSWPTLAGVVRALGGDLYAGGRRANVPGPGHSPADRSVSLLLSGGRVVVHAFAGDDWRTVLADLAARGLVDAQGRLLCGRGGPPLGDASGPRGPERPHRAARIAVAARLWAEGRPLADTLSARHLARRGVDVPECGLGHHPAVAAAVYADAGPRRPALLAAIRAPADGAVVGVEVTYLAPDGDRARMGLARKTVGVVPPGAAVRLARPGARLLVGEGVFTCLSAGRRFGLPAWALLSSRRMRSWEAPDGVRAVFVAADRGVEGVAAARALAARLRARGLAVGVRLPPAPFGDWNEAEAVARAREEE